MIKFENLKFMSIGSNCADLWYLGQTRVHGPVDNIVIKSTAAIESLLDKTFLTNIYTEPFVEEPKLWAHTDDLNIILNYKDFKLVHNNPNTDKFKQELSNRLERLNTFINNIQQKENCWLVFNLNKYFVNEKHEATTEFTKLINLLKTKNLFTKTIFVQLKKRKLTTEHKWDAWLAKQDNLPKVITIYDVTDAKLANMQFKQQIKQLLKGE